MGTAEITNVLDVAAVRQLLQGPQGGVVKDLMRRGLLVESAAKRNLQRAPTRVNTGRLRSSIAMRMITYSGAPACRVGTNVDYALYVHDGTGLFGPLHRLIRPVNKKVLRWKTRGGSGKSRKGYTYSLTSRGMKPNPFLKDALSAAKG